MSTIQDISGQRFSKLTAIKFHSKSNRGVRLWLCKCDCGNERLIPVANLRNGNSKSCGCSSNEAISIANTKHGGTQSDEYSCWTDIKTRCYNSKSKYFYNYGGRGIKVCDRWLHSFENFLGDMGEKPSKSHSLDRYPDIDGDYSPENCRWATWVEQQNNKRSNIFIEHEGQRLTVADWNRLFKRTHHFLYRKMKKYSFEYIYEKNKHRITQPLA